MSKFDKMLTRKKMMSDPEYCNNVRFFDFETMDDGTIVRDDKGNKIPVFDRCGKKMRPRKLKNVTQWICTRKGCGQKRYVKRSEQVSAVSVYEKE